MSENNQIQEISEYIDGVKKLIFKEVFKGVLDSKDAPFSSEVDVYLKELVNSDITDPYKIGIVSLEKQGTNYVVSLSGPFKSYIEVNGVACYNQEVYSMTKQADGSFVSEDIPMVHRNDEVQFSVSQEIWNIMLGLYQRDPWGRQ